MPAKPKPWSSWIVSALTSPVLLALAVPGAIAAPADPLDAPPDVAQASPTAAPAADSELLLAVDINGQAYPDTVVVLRRADGSFWAPAISFDRWRLRRPALPAWVHGGVPYLPLSAIAGATFAYDQVGQRLAITAPPAAFTETRIFEGTRPIPPPTLPSPGAFLNYDVYAARAAGQSQYAGQFEAGLFSRYGVLTTGGLAQHAGGERRVTRLDTVYTLDFPGRMVTLRAGDAATSSGTWGRAVRFAGVQYGTNFALQPGFVTFPTVAANGQTALPSTVDVFVNNVLVGQRPVAPGPFSIAGIPTVSGTGDVQLVIKDVLGREQVITQPFYSAAVLLKPGLSQYSIEAGVERNDFGTASADYGGGLASATLRRGITAELTAEARAEATRHTAAFGASADWLIGELGIVRGILAASHADDVGAGTLLGGGFERRTPVWSVAAQMVQASPDFRVLGASASNPLPRRQMIATVGAQLGRYGSAGVTWIEQDFRIPRDGRTTTDIRIVQDVRLLSIGYTVSLGRLGFLSIAALKPFAGDAGVSVTATLTVPLSPLDWASLAQNAVRGGSAGNRNDGSITLQRNLPAGEGIGYRVFADTRSEFSAALAYQGEVGTYAVEGARFGGTNVMRGTVAGGLGYVGGHAFASRAITESFAVVRVADYEGVRVTQDNQPVARTNAGGYAVLPRLRAYDVNPISVVQHDLPLDAEIASLTMAAVPYYRSGVMLEFPVRRARGAVFRLRLDDGAEMPSGALVDVVGGAASFPVALEGVVYVTGLAAHNRLLARWKGQSCEFDLALPASPDPLPDLGTIHCRGVAR